jgi:hypothetical protein
MRKTPLWCDEHEAEFIRLARLGHSAARLHVHFKRPMPLNEIRSATRYGWVLFEEVKLEHAPSTVMLLSGKQKQRRQLFLPSKIAARRVLKMLREK